MLDPPNAATNPLEFVPPEPLSVVLLVRASGNQVLISVAVHIDHFAVVPPGDVVLVVLHIEFVEAVSGIDSLAPSDIASAVPFSRSDEIQVPIPVKVAGEYLRNIRVDDEMTRLQPPSRAPACYPVYPG